MTSTNEPATPDWLREIVELHKFFERWLGGCAADGPEDATMARLERVLGPAFTIVTPSGQILEREALLSGLAAARGSRPGLRIEIEEPTLIAETPSQTIARYTEVQHADGATTRRISSVVFERTTGAPNGLRWLHLQETWL